MRPLFPRDTRVYILLLLTLNTFSWFAVVLKCVPTAREILRPVLRAHSNGPPAARRSGPQRVNSSASSDTALGRSDGRSVCAVQARLTGRTGTGIALLPLTLIYMCAMQQWANPFRALVALRRHLHSSLSPARFLHPRIPRTCNAFLWATSSHLVVAFPTDLVLWNLLLRTFFIEILSSPIFMV